MARFTELQLAIHDVLDVWMNETGGIRFTKHERPYTALAEAVEKYVKKKEEADAIAFRRAVETAYQSGFDAGRNLKG